MWPFSSKKKKAEVAIKRAYAGATFGRLVADWIAQGTSMDAEIRGSLRALRNRSRALGRDNDYAREIFRTIRRNVVGKGIPFQAQVRKQLGGELDDKTNAMIEKAWTRWTRKDSCHTAGMLNFDAISRLVMGSIAESGEVLVRLVYQKMGSSRVPLAIELIESDCLDENFNGVAENGNQVRMGVEIDQWKRPVAYHFLTKHPGDYQYGAASAYQSAAGERRRVDAKEILHLFITERIDQTRGVPWMASAIMRLHHLQGFEEGTIVQARAAAALMGFIETPEGDLPSDGVQDGERITEFQPGTWKYLAQGEKAVIPSTGTPKADIEPFTRLMLRGAAAGIGTAYESISKDYSQSNYSSSRLAIIDERDEWKILQSWFIDNFCQPIFEAWLEMAVLSGELKLKNYELNPDFYSEVRWMPRGWAWIDPLKDVNACKQAVRSGFSTLTDVVAQNGGDIEEVLRIRARENDLAEKLGLVLDTDPKMVSETGITQNPSGPDPADNPDNDPQDGHGPQKKK